MPIDKSEIIARELHLDIRGVNAAITLLKEGNTVPFIARYRKEVTGSLTDEDLRHLEERLSYLCTDILFLIFRRFNTNTRNKCIWKT